MAEMLHHTKAVVRGTRQALVIGDMPFLTYASSDEALENAGRFLQEAGAQAVKVEGGVRSARIIEAMVKAGIPVMGHIGWTPQAQHGMGGKVKVQGKDRTQARALLADALAVQEAGAFSIVLELVPAQLAGAITDRLSIPTIGIGAGPLCSGQVQVVTDLLGLGDFVPRHARPYANLRKTIGDAARAFAADVAAGTFPGDAETVRMDDAVLDEALGRGASDRATGEAPVGRHPARPRPLNSRDPSARRRAMTKVLRTRAELREALDDAPRPIGLVTTMGWLHDGHRALIRRRPPGERDDGRDDLRQPAAVQRGRRLHAVPAQRRAGRRDLRDPRARTSCSPRTFPRSTRRGSTRACRSGRSPSRWRARRDPAISMAWPPSWRSCSGWSAPTARTSARRTRSRSWSSARWRTTWRSAPRSSPARRSASPTASRCRRATSTSPLPSVRRPRSCGARCSRPGDAWEGGERSGDALRARMRDVLASEPLAEVDYVSVADGRTLAELDVVDGPALASLAVRFGSTRLIDNELLDDDAGTEARPQVYGG